MPDATFTATQSVTEKALARSRLGVIGTFRMVRKTALWSIREQGGPTLGIRIEHIRIVRDGWAPGIYALTIEGCTY